MTLNRRAFTKSVAGALGFLAPSAGLTAARAQTPAPAVARAAARLSSTKITKIRVFYPPNYMTEAAAGPTHRRPDGSLTHW